MDRTRRRPRSPRRAPGDAGCRRAGDPDTARLVEQVFREIRRRPRRGGRDPAPEPRPAAGVVLCVLLLLLLGRAGLDAGGPAAARAGPIETRRELAAAKTLADGPWPTHARALQAVARGAGRADPARSRALVLWARALARAGHAEAARAALAHAAGASPPGSSARTRARRALGRSLLEDGDLAAARRVLEPLGADAAADLLRLGSEAGDAALLAHVLEGRLPPEVAIDGWGRLGLLRLARGDRRGARRCLRAAAAILRGLGARTDPEARRAAKTWLDLPLRDALP